jgi:hypothetical protein
MLKQEETDEDFQVTLSDQSNTKTREGIRQEGCWIVILKNKIDLMVRLKTCTRTYYNSHFKLYENEDRN